MVLSAHTLRVCRLYRRALKTTLDWAIDRELFINESKGLRQRFEANRHVRSQALAEKLVMEGEAEAETWKHPSPYKSALASWRGHMSNVL